MLILQGVPPLGGVKQRWWEKQAILYQVHSGAAVVECVVVVVVYKSAASRDSWVGELHSDF